MFTLLYWIFCFSFAFDFRGDEGGSIIQYLFLAASLGSAGLMLAATPKAMLQRPVIIMSAVWWGYLATTAVIIVEAHVPVSQYIRCVLPPALCGLAILIGQALSMRNYTAEMVLKPLLWASIASVIFRFVFTVFVTGIPISLVRYEILSPAVPLLFACAFASAVLGKKLNLLTLTGGLLALASVAISITRSYIFTITAAVIAVGVSFLLMVSYRAWEVADLRRKITHFASAAALMVVTMVVLYMVQPIVFERWFERLFNDGGGKTVKDVTLLTREAEASTMWKLLEDDPIRFIYGKGLGANYYWDRTYFPELLKVYGDTRYIAQDYWFPGHSVWTYALFSGGWFAVACYLFLFGWQIVMGIAGGRYALQTRSASPDLAFLPFVIGLCYFSQTLTSNPFGERFSAQILGLCAALPQFFLAPKYLRQTSATLLDYSSTTPNASPTAHRAG